MTYRCIVIACAAAILLPGCATVTSSEMQNLTLSAKTNEGEAVENAKCTLKNDRGAWEMVSPGTVAVRRSGEDLIVECKKEGFANGLLRAISRAAGGMWGNVLIGGGIGALIDHSNGKGYNYPDDLPVRMGQSVTVDRNKAPTQADTQTSDSKLTTAAN